MHTHILFYLNLVFIPNSVAILLFFSLFSKPKIIRAFYLIEKCFPLFIFNEIRSMALT